MTYQTTSHSVVNLSLAASQVEFRNRREVLIVPEEYIVHDLGLTLAFDLTPFNAEYIENELRIRQLLDSDTIVKAMLMDFRLGGVKLYIYNPKLDIVPVGEYAPERTLTPT